MTFFSKQPFALCGLVALVVLLFQYVRINAAAPGPIFRSID